MNKDIKYLIEKLFDDDLLNNDELTLDELNIEENISDYVDLGLTSGTLWCKHNIGTNKPEGYGDYLTFDEATKKYDNLPTKELYKELYDECVWEWSLLNGVNGYKVIGKNKNFIFLPAAGDISKLGISNIGTHGYYWSSSCEPIYDTTLQFYFLFLYIGGIELSYFIVNYYKFTVRQVKKI